jgi:hypothetical protein
MAATTVSRTDQVLAAARDNHRATTGLEVERILLAVQWAELHPGEEPDPQVEWAMRPLELAGDGAPTIDEAAVAEFALAVGMKHEPGANLIADALELVHRLPKIWARVAAGEVPVWKARRIAENTITLPFEAAAAVDRHLALIAKRCSFAEIQRQVEKARAEHDPDEAERRRIAAAQQRCVEVHYRGITPDGMVPITGYAGLGDALAFDTWLTATAATLEPSIPLDVRRSMALGMVGTAGEGQRELVLYAHARPGQAMVEVENTRTVVTPEQIREWCQTAGTRVTIRPVLDLAEERATDVHDPTPLMREQVWALYPQCVFPACERPSRSCDIDHRIPWPHGATTTSNLYPLCRGHHRLKTTGGWTYRPLDPTTIEWTSPAGYRYLRHIR